MSAARKEPALRLIIAYKLTKGCLQLIASAVFAVLITLGLARHLNDYAVHVHAQFTGAWSAWLARAIVRASGHLWLVTCALAFDGLLAGIEGWSLARGFRWAPWLVVITTSTLLPFEVIEIARKAQPVRILVLAVNVAIVVYLARRALWHVRSRSGPTS